MRRYEDRISELKHDLTADFQEQFARINAIKESIEGKLE